MSAESSIKESNSIPNAAERTDHKTPFSVKAVYHTETTTVQHAKLTDKVTQRYSEHIY